MKNFNIKNLFQRLWYKPKNEELSCLGCSLKLTNKEIVFLHFSLSLTKREANANLNSLSEFQSPQYILEEYYCTLIQDCERLVSLLEQEIRKRKISKTYLDFKIASNLRFKTSGIKHTEIKPSR